MKLGKPPLCLGCSLQSEPGEAACKGASRDCELQEAVHGTALGRNQHQTAGTLIAKSCPGDWQWCRTHLHLELPVDAGSNGPRRPGPPFEPEG